ncbi:hypothetical protein Vadar_009434 [Vaccinium darrowii]|uniref:Uncharacterized protein n=1 Tax=Vaccinium darrowii TaxID=229202 RepID=A0ACB7YDS7_9ERIC|nr:hypothetical protein Vadar_009434 [Vaccinium darrowii]
MVNASGIWASLRESALLQRAEDFHSPSPSAALNYSLQLGNQCGAAHSKLFCTSTAEGYGFKTDLLIGDVVRDEIFAEAGENIEGSLVCLAVRRGGETLTLLPGTIIRSDGIVATSASRLYFFKSKELKTTLLQKKIEQNQIRRDVRLGTYRVDRTSSQIDVKVLDRKATYEGVLLDADICSNVAFIKIMSPEQQEVARFGKLNSQRVLTSVAVGCTAESHCGLPYANSRYCMSPICSVANEIENGQSDARTSRQVINAKVDEMVSVVGGPLVDTYLGVVGVIHYQDGCQIKATPIDDVFKCLERFEKQQETSS